MPTRIAHTHRRIAWLAFLAIGLLALAPTVSRTLVALSLMRPMPMVMGHAAGRAGHGHRSAGPHAPAPRMPAPSTDDCGYCILLFHSPVAAWMPAVLPCMPLAVPPPPRWDHADRSEPSIVERRSRSPPRLA